jgi:putative transposase
MLCFMSHTGDGWDNAPMESFFGSLKPELEDDGFYDTPQAARNARCSFIESFDDRDRLHSTIGCQTPSQMEANAVAA